MGLVKLGISVALAGALSVVGGQAVGRAGVSVRDAVQRVQAGDVRPVMALLVTPPHGGPSGVGPTLHVEHRQGPPAAEMVQTVGDVARFAGLLMGAGPAMLVEGYGLARHRTQGVGRVAVERG